jgi:hypothetical protein
MSEEIAKLVCPADVLQWLEDIDDDLATIAIANPDLLHILTTSAP